MQGQFISNRSRLQLAHQSRKTHFAFGRTSHGYSTTQTSVLTPRASSFTPGRSSNCRTASHFTLGTESCRSRSEFGRNYRPHQVETPKPKPLIKELNPSSVVLGTQRMRFNLTSNEIRDTSRTRIESYSNTPLKNRRTNFELGNDRVTKGSIMQKEFKKVAREKSFEVEKNLLDSHIVMGSHPEVKQSTTKNQYFLKQGPPGRLMGNQLNNLKQEHFILGNDKKNDKATEYSTFQSHLISKQGLPEYKLNYLKNSHFSFTSEKPDYISASKESLKYNQAEIRPQERYLKENHVVLGNNKQNFISNYSKNHHYRSHSLNNPKITKNEELRSDVILGVSKQFYNTTNDESLTGKHAHAVRLDPQYEKKLRYHHDSLGDGKPVYDLIHKNYGSGEPDPSHFLQGHKIDLLSTHWKTGTVDVRMASSMKSNYQTARVERRNQEDYLKKHNYRLGDSQNDWKSSYQGKFKWIHPVPDNNIKFSFN